MLPRETPNAEKVRRAEDRVLVVRALIIVFNTMVYAFVLDPAIGVPWLAWTVIAVALAYGMGVLALRPHRYLPALMSGWFTTLTDSLLITLWIVATGGVDSPFFPLWYVSLIAIGFRFGLRETVVAGVVYSGLYLGLVAVLGQLPANLGEMAIRTAYIGFATAVAALFARESAFQVRAKVDLGRMVTAVGAVTRELDVDRALERVAHAARELADVDRVAVYLLDAHGQRLGCAYAERLSQSYLDLRTRLFRSLPGAPVFSGAPLVHVEDAAREEGLGGLREAAVREGIHTYVVLPLRVDGETIGVLSLYRDRVKPFDAQELQIAETLADRAATTLANARLVKHLRQSEESLRKVVESSPVILFAVDHNGIMTMARGAGLRNIGFEGRPLVGESVYELYRDHPGILRNIRRALAGESFTDVLMIGDAVFETHYAPVLSEEGDVRGASGVAVDVTTRQQAETQRMARLAEAQELERLKEVDRLKTLFMNTAAHELRTPLTPIKVQLHLLRGQDKDRLTARQLDAMEVLERNIDRLGNLVEDLLEGTRLQAGGMVIQRRVVDLNRVIHEAVESFDEPARRAGVRLEARLRPNLLVNADAKRLIQVLFNLLANALKFTPRGGEITVETERVTGSAVVRVRDTGAGLTLEQAERLFKPFSQVHDTMERTRSGTGLGLYISRSIVELHGGQIRVESDGPGKGSVFTFTLPLETAPEAEPRHPAKAWSDVGILKARTETPEPAPAPHAPIVMEPQPIPGAAASGVDAVATPSAESVLTRAERDRLERRARELV